MNPNMDILRRAVIAALALTPSAGFAQTVWSANTTPVQSTITGGPWTLNDGPLATPATATSYCVNGVENTAANPGATLFNPYYFPFIVGNGPNLVGYFDYRPSGVNETTVAAISYDAGQTWTYEQQALQITTACPSSNAPSGDDDGLGHPFMISFGGANFLYLLDRRSGHVDSDGLTVHRIQPTVAQPLNASPALNATAVTVGPVSNVGVFAGWTFDSLPIAENNSPAPDLGTATAKATPLGMTNSYYCLTSPVGQNSITYADVEAGYGSSSTGAAGANDWRIRGEDKTSNTSAPCDGWSLQAPQETQGAEFDADTTGVTNVIFQYDWASTADGIRDLQAQYSLNVKASTPVWTNIGGVQVAAAKAYQNGLQINFTGIAGVGNNKNFGVRLVSVYDPTLAAGSYTLPSPIGTVNYAAGQEYSNATLGAAGAGVVYDDNSGNWRFDNVKFYDASKIVATNGSTATDYSVETTGLLNPDGILAVIPNTSGDTERKVLYIQKQLDGANAAYTCPNPGPAGKINYDVDTIRVAGTTDGIHFTDRGATNLLDPTTISNLGLRYAAPNGSIIKLHNGNLGLFFATGNCQDGDSDGFHAIVYAETTRGNLLNWTVVNGMNNPIAEVGFGQVPATAPLTGMGSLNSTDPTGWFGGRAYTPMVIWQDNNDVSLVFAGYDYGYFGGTDLSNYRTIGQISLHSTETIDP